MLDESHLTPIETKILIALIRSKHCALHTDEILRQTGIATSTWSAEQGKLVGMGLIEKHMVRIIENNQICKRMNYELTDKGKKVGSNLLNISEILSPDASEKQKIPDHSIFCNPKEIISDSLELASGSENFDDAIGDCVEIALDSFGSNLVNLVKNSLELEHSVQWTDLSDKIETFDAVLKDYFGVGSAQTLKKLISANIRSRFELGGSYQGDDLSYLISEARKKNLENLKTEGHNPEKEVGT